MIIYLSSSVGLAVLIVAAGMPLKSHAQPDPYHITAAEKAACTFDAERLCASSYPDEAKLLGCMQANRASLTSTCLAVFDAGVKRRHLVAR